MQPSGPVALQSFPVPGSAPTKSLNKDRKTSYESSPVASLSQAPLEMTVPGASSSRLPVKVQCQEGKMAVTVQRELFRKDQLVNQSHLSLGSPGC